MGTALAITPKPRSTALTIPPQRFDWTGEWMLPVYPRLADRYFAVGESYWLAEPKERSDKSHSQYFAVIYKAWENLPEALALEFPSAEDLRARALIACGYANSRQFVATTKGEAVRLAAFIRHGREYSVVTVSGFTVTEFTAMSQSFKAMGKDAFQASKTAVFEYLAAMLSVTVAQLVNHSQETT